MTEKGPTIDDIRQLHDDLLTLVIHGLVYAFSSDAPDEPVFKAAVQCTAEEIASAIPLSELIWLLHKKRLAFLAALN